MNAALGRVGAPHVALADGQHLVAELGPPEAIDRPALLKSIDRLALHAPKDAILAQMSRAAKGRARCDSRRQRSSV